MKECLYIEITPFPREWGAKEWAGKVFFWFIAEQSTRHTHVWGDLIMHR